MCVVCVCVFLDSRATLIIERITDLITQLLERKELLH